MACIAYSISHIPLAGHAFQFFLLTTFAAWILIFGLLVAVNYCDVPVPRAVTAMGMDALFVIMLFAASIAVAVTDPFQDCDHGSTKCRVLKTAVSFGFLAMAAFLGTLVMGGCSKESELDNGVDESSQTPMQHHPYSTTDVNPKKKGGRATAPATPSTSV